MATSLADLAAKRANPKGETSTEMERRLRMEKARRDAQKRPIPQMTETVEPDDHSKVVPLLPIPNRTVKRPVS